MADSIYTPELAQQICLGIASGRSLRSICEDDDMPDKATVLRWALSHEGFRDQYTRAREMQAEGFYDDILEIADDRSNDAIETRFGEIPNAEFIMRSKVRIDTRKWLMARMLPKKYGDAKSIDVTSQGQRVTGFAIVDYTQDDSAA